jgi:hypothetical protein
MKSTVALQRFSLVNVFLCMGCKMRAVAPPKMLPEISICDLLLGINSEAKGDMEI